MNAKTHVNKSRWHVWTMSRRLKLYYKVLFGIFQNVPRWAQHNGCRTCRASNDFIPGIIHLSGAVHYLLAMCIVLRLGSPSLISGPGQCYRNWFTKTKMNSLMIGYSFNKMHMKLMKLSLLFSVLIVLNRRNPFESRTSPWVANT